MGAAAFVLAIASNSSWTRRRPDRFFRVLPSSNSSLGTSQDEENISSSSSTKEQDGSSNNIQLSVISRPCIVRPGTLGADPKVRFLLLAKSNSTSNGEEEDFEDVDLEVEKQPAIEEPPSNFASIFRYSCISNISEWVGPSIISQSNSFRSFADSSVSSTTPILNPIDDKLSREWIVAPSVAPPIITRWGIRMREDDEGLEALGIVVSKSSSTGSSTDSSPCRILRELNRREQKLGSRRISSSKDAKDDGLLQSPRSSVVVDWPLLGIRPATNGDGEDDVIEVVEIRGGPKKQWLEVTEMHV
jgi:hypothetical protein